MPGFGPSRLPVRDRCRVGSAFGPSITLSHSIGDSTIAAKIVDLITDGSVNVTASDEKLPARAIRLSQIRCRRSFRRPFAGRSISAAVRRHSTGDNEFIGARVTEISITQRNVTV